MKKLNEKIDELLKHGQTFNYWTHGYDFPHRSKQIFQDIDFEGKNMLEIGCGKGLFSIWASLHGAKQVVGLEPLVEGSRRFDQSKVYSEFKEIVGALKLSNINIYPNRIQDYQNQKVRFDIVLSVASVNHLDEDSCTHLHEKDIARANYKAIFKDIADKMNEGGKLIVLDCSCRNFFGDIGLTNPMEKSIEWFKHQTPECWVDLLTECGFTNPTITWPSGSYLRHCRVYNRSKLLSYFIDSCFRIEMTYGKTHTKKA